MSHAGLVTNLIALIAEVAMHKKIRIRTFSHKVIPVQNYFHE